MTLYRRLLRLLAIAIPLVWAIAVATSLLTARHEVNELFDSEQVLVAQQILGLATRADALPGAGPDGAPGSRAGPGPRHPSGAADLDDFAITLRDADGRIRYLDHDDIELPPAPPAGGFASTEVRGHPWRVYYLWSSDRNWQVAVGQAIEERNEIIGGLLAGQLLPWLLMLPVLLIAMSLALRHALRPVRQLAARLQERNVDDLRSLDKAGLPAEIHPLVDAMNELFERLQSAIDHERRLTSDAAHELRTPLAAVRSQWDAMRLAGTPASRASAEAQVGRGIQRLERVSTQLLALAGVEASSRQREVEEIDWRQVVQEAMSDCLPLMHSSGGEVAVEWCADGEAPLPLSGESALLGQMLRNLIENALRYGGAEPRVVLRLAGDSIVVEDDGPGIDPALLPRLGSRFFRAAGPDLHGSGLGLSIVQRIAELHGLSVSFRNREAPEHGLQVTVRRVGGTLPVS